jgi:hypothetical protein
MSQPLPAIIWDYFISELNKCSAFLNYFLALRRTSGMSVSDKLKDRYTNPVT